MSALRGTTTSATMMTPIVTMTQTMMVTTARAMGMDMERAMEAATTDRVE